MSEERHTFPHIRIEGGPDGGSLKIYRDGVLMPSVVEFQINGGLETPVTAIFKEIVTFDGSVELLPRRKTDPSAH
jgi:hypothetical protein